MGGLAWHTGGLLLDMGGLGCLRALAPMLVFLFHTPGGHYGGPSYHLWDIPPFVFQRHGVPAAPELVLHTAALGISSLGNPVAPLGSMHHANVLSLLTMSFSPLLAFTGHPFPGTVPLAHEGIPGVLPAISGGIPLAPPLPPVAPPVPAVPPVSAVVPVVVPAVVPTAPAVVPATPVPIAPVAPAPPIAPLCASSGHFQWGPGQAPQAQHDDGCQSLPGFVEQIHFYLWMPELAWEGQLRLIVKKGSLQFLFGNKGSLGAGALKCLPLSCSIVVLTPSPMPSLLSSPSSMMSKVTLSPSSNIVPGLTESLFNWLVAGCHPVYSSGDAVPLCSTWMLHCYCQTVLIVFQAHQIHHHPLERIGRHISPWL
jgi:hypothetical protein